MFVELVMSVEEGLTLPPRRNPSVTTSATVGLLGTDIDYPVVKQTSVAAFVEFVRLVVHAIVNPVPPRNHPSGNVNVNPPVAGNGITWLATVVPTVTLAAGVKNICTYATAAVVLYRMILPNLTGTALTSAFVAFTCAE